MTAPEIRAAKLAAEVRAEQAAGQITNKEAQDRIWLIAAAANLSATTDEVVDLENQSGRSLYLDRFKDRTSNQPTIRTDQNN